MRQYKLGLRIAALFMLNIILICVIQIAGASAAVTYSRGSTGETVKKIQQVLADKGYYAGSVDGIFGSGTTSAVKKFQSANGLTADGVVGSKTLAKLGISSSNVETKGKTISGTLKQGSSGNDVELLQQALKNKGYYMGAIDGNFGAGTFSAVKAFQNASRLTVDGVAGSKTLKALGFTVKAASSSASLNNRSADLKLLARLISSEARGEPYNGQVAVGAVVLNRMKHPSFPKTMHGVIYQPKAFTAITDGNFNKPVAEISYQAAADALNGVDPSHGAIFYFNPKATSDKFLHSLKAITVTIGNHRFAKG